MAGIEPFTQFLARTATARPEDHAEALHEGARANGLDTGASAAEFQRMKDHILGLYRGATPTHSFTDPAGNVFDCIPYDQLPTVRGAREAGFDLPTAPPTPQAHPASSSPPTPGAAGIGAGQGICPPGTVPLRRLTLEQLVPLGRLENHFLKSPPVVLPRSQSVPDSA